MIELLLEDVQPHRITCRHSSVLHDYRDETHVLEREGGRERGRERDGERERGEGEREREREGEGDRERERSEHVCISL